MSIYRRILRGADSPHPHWVELEEEKCLGENFHALRKFCEAHAGIFREAFGGERMHPSERGEGAGWARWKKASLRR